jgi:hypothetical protein
MFVSSVLGSAFDARRSTFRAAAHFMVAMRNEPDSEPRTSNRPEREHELSGENGDA